MRINRLERLCFRTNCDYGVLCAEKRVQSVAVGHEHHRWVAPSICKSFPQLFIKQKVISHGGLGADPQVHRANNYVSDVV
eukprot:CAMPEP_0202053384 /NCGR_PEP_ID=MMETSP0963-20130614/5824_1 /ASSEMBLY_ACC=CAM_ASM_000494 /TAXON_ID=4773 /ORGANISM="Schizochytrium aggregatum, Strain ATCC28209" /LENGTH=79 /DNA_ID=CAMNT_0048618715 /DNA_START=418 /DNA_END=654 /DNA_ORIENTATION=+